MELPIEYRRVSFGPRLGAFLIDQVTKYTIAILVGLYFYSKGLTDVGISEEILEALQSAYRIGGMSRSDSQSMASMVGAIIPAFIIVSAAYSLIELIWGTSPGKLTLGLRIAQSNGQRATRIDLAKRWSVKFIGDILKFMSFIAAIPIIGTIGGFLSFVVFFGYFAALADARMALHDRIAQTAVFRTRDITG